MTSKQKKHLKKMTFRYLGAVCKAYCIDIDEVRQDIEKIIIRIEKDDEMIMCDFRAIIVRLFQKRKDNASYSQVKKDIYDVMEKLNEPDKLSFACKLVGVQSHAVLLYLMDEYEEDER
ncbi:hypothetical protein [Bacillus albus]|uniref:hypothetical protein n=1 Tax=Bacillus albus TaxID=2026189 RepID=UPI00101E9A60|nr:hypothetical protein [Bacillus albus]